jgi:hypothetical protein
LRPQAGTANVCNEHAPCRGEAEQCMVEYKAQRGVQLLTRMYGHPQCLWPLFASLSRPLHLTAAGVPGGSG